jgi:hypothetical protein
MCNEKENLLHQQALNGFSIIVHDDDDAAYSIYIQHIIML